MHTSRFRPATLATLNSPLAVLADGFSGVYIADTFNHALRRVFSNGTIISVSGNGTAAYCGDGGRASLACLSSPSGLALDSFGGGLLVADTGNSLVRLILSNGTIVSVVGTPFRSSYTGDGGPASSATAGTICGKTDQRKRWLSQLARICRYFGRYSRGWLGCVCIC